jgi:hypothetical protein
MEITYDSIVKWFNAYFDTFNKSNAGPLSSVLNMKKYFADDLEFWGYHQAGPRPSSRGALLTSMVHPGLLEHLTPLEYTVDLQQLIVVVQFRIVFSDLPSGQSWHEKQTSTHYHLILDKKGEIKIKKILYFMESRPPEEGTYRALWAKYREKELAEHKDLVSQLN